MNKKALYESIMKNVAKQVKKALNEGMIYQDPELRELWDNMISDGIATEKELELITDINGYKVESLLDVLYSRTGYHTWEQYAGDDEDEEVDNSVIKYAAVFNALEGLSEEELQEIVDNNGLDMAELILEYFLDLENADNYADACAEACAEVAEQLLNGHTIKELRMSMEDDEI